jgi:hypothetical protein
VGPYVYSLQSPLVRLLPHASQAHLLISSPLFLLPLPSSETSKGSTGPQPFTDATHPKEEVSVAPLSQQQPYESRRLWKEVSDGIRTGDFDKASAAKTKIEVEQREMRKQEAAQGKSWGLRYFAYSPSDPDCTFFFFTRILLASFAGPSS